VRVPVKYKIAAAAATMRRMVRSVEPIFLVMA
jgi:hypothetical protein